MDSQVDPEAETQLVEDTEVMDSQVDPEAETQVMESRDRSRSCSGSRSRSSKSRSRWGSIDYTLVLEYLSTQIIISVHSPYVHMDLLQQIIKCHNFWQVSILVRQPLWSFG